MKRILERAGRLLPAAAAVVAVCAVLPTLMLQPPAVEAAAWGLSFRADGQTPVGNAGREELRRYDAAYAGSGEEPVIYLTFDAGYENGLTGQILDVLAAHEVKAASFVVGSYLEREPDLVRRMAEEGHTVGNHTYHHYDMSRLSDETAFREELTSVAEKYAQITGSPMPMYYRPPRGIYSTENLRMAQALGYRTVFWSLAYVDWYQNDQPTKQEAFAKLLPRIHPGAVVLLHATSQTNAEILDELLTRWEQMGYRFGTLDELFSEPF